MYIYIYMYIYMYMYIHVYIYNYKYILLFLSVSFIQFQASHQSPASLLAKPRAEVPVAAVDFHTKPVIPGAWWLVVSTSWWLIIQ